MRRILVGMGLLLAVAARAGAQSAPAAGTVGGPAGTVGLAYGVLRSQEATSPVGFAIDVARRLVRSANGVDVLLAGELGVNHFAESIDFDATTQVSFLVGLRFAGRTRSGASPFGQILVGGISCCGSTDRAIQAGAGIDVPIARKAANFRLQADVPVAYFSAGVDSDGVPYAAGSSTGFRFSVGVSFHVGR